MLEQNKEDKEETVKKPKEDKEEVIVEKSQEDKKETSEDKKEISIEKTEVKEENEFTKGETHGEIKFQDTIKAALIDIVTTGIISIAALFIFDVLLRAIAGYYVTDKGAMLLIFYVISSLFYTSIIEYKKKDTIGKRVSQIKLHKTI